MPEYANTYKNVKLIGTSHIAKGSIDLIAKTFSEYSPDIVCVELDRGRLHALLTDEKPDRSLRGIRTYGLQGYLFALIGGFIQGKLGNVVGVKPGSDMLAAVNLARREHKQLELIDQDIAVTLKRFSKSFTWREKFRIVADIVKAPFSKRMKIDLNNVPEHELVSKLILQVKDRYPSIYKVLIEERNYVMAKNIYNIMSKNPEKNILVIIGAGHEREMLKLIKQEDFRRDKVHLNAALQKF
jgi:pheromone shutdown-related protein TraB